MLKRNIANEKSQSLFENSLDVWLSTKEAAKFLSITPNALRIMVCRGYVKPDKLRGRNRFRKSELRSLFFKRMEI